MRIIGTLLVLGLAGLAAGAVASLTAPGQELLTASVVRIEALQSEAKVFEARIQEFERAGDADATGPAIDWVAQTAPEAVLDLQQAVVDLARRNRLEPSTFGSHPAPAGLTLPAVGVVLEGEGEIADLARFLAAIEAAQPPIAVAQLTLRDQSRRRTEGSLAPVAFRIAAWGFWAEGGG